ncbi:pyridoxal phosphate-dependent transferase [Dunaliella salina]|uniref:sphinganine-1-phosphate aldolase n=1 Tax=Dunaliella salina TaxID=3046 RepID=A0ABQ7GJZ7_DUNSA|nr:pyridoxal phosphate-dependent transferase [Dunaliella salina]|eukprot:KAF5834927.1 pyridoxal phosphate-dependent transferase [Dunaliella salina]
MSSLVQTAHAIVEKNAPVLMEAGHVAAAAMKPYLEAFNNLCTGMEAWEVAARTAAVVIVSAILLNRLRSLVTNIVDDGGFLPALFKSIRSIPFVSRRLQQEKAKVRGDLLQGRSYPTPPLTELPLKGKEPKDLLQQITQKSQGDTQIEHGRSHISGAVYIGSANHRKMLDQVYSMFAVSNPLHASVFPSVRQMEAEVVAMTGRMLGGGGEANPEVCGAMTSGGSESILLAMKAARDWARNKRGVRRPELIIARSAHAAYYKAAEYFKMRLITLPVDKDWRLSGETVKRALTSNTAAVVASAPGFPHGVVDHIEDIAKVCRRKGVWLHVDACLGGFVLPFARKLGRQIPPFDFSVPVSSWRGRGSLESRELVQFGDKGCACMPLFKEGIDTIPELEVMGSPEMSVVAIQARDPAKLNVYKLNDLMEKAGWHWNALQSPPALHFCFTPNHVGNGSNGKQQVDVVQQLLEGLRASVATLMANPDAVQGGSAPMYGMANVVPDRGMIGEFLVAYQDVMLLP